MADRRGDQGLQEIVRCHRKGEQEGNVGSSIERGSVFRLYAAEKGGGKGDERENRST